MPADTTKHRRVIRSLNAEANALLQEIIDALTAAGHDSDTVFSVRLAMDEALANAIRHGNKSDTQKTVAVEWELKPRSISLSVEDQGGGFDPGGVPDPTLEENLTRPSGRGVMLMRAYMSSVTFNANGNRVTLVKAV